MGIPKEDERGFTYADYAQWPDDERWELIDGVAWNMSPAPARNHQWVVGHVFRIVADLTDAGPCQTYIAPFDVRLPEPPPGAGQAGPAAEAGRNTREATSERNAQAGSPAADTAATASRGPDTTSSSHAAAAAASSHAAEPPDDAVTTVVQPDVSVFCDPELLDDRGAHGPPDLIVEVLSPATSYKDQTDKLALYERHAVREYWIVNPDARWVMVYRLTADRRYAKPDYYCPGDTAVSHVLAGAELDIARFFA